MYLAVMPRNNNRKYLAIVHGYRDENGKSKRKTILSIGYLDELEKEYEDPIAHFKEVAAKMEKERKEENSAFQITLSANERLKKDENNLYNLGYAALSKIYHELQIHTFLRNRQRHTNEEFDLNTIMKMLVFSRVLYPASKKNSYENRTRFFENTDYSLDSVYRALSSLNKYRDALQLKIHEEISKRYGRDTSLLYYDVTNYYFETDEQDGFRMKGVSKEKRKDPIVQMGLFMDTNGIPVSYELFPGNTNDCLTFRPNLKRIKTDFELGRVITVADKAMTTGDNIWYTINTQDKDGYVFSMSLRGAGKELKTYALSEDGYEWFGDSYKRKSRLYPRSIKITTVNGKKRKKTVDEKQVVFWSEKYAKRAKAEREATLNKAKDLIRNPGKYTRETSYGAAKYIMNLVCDESTGEILTGESKLEINEELIKEEEVLDGYYLIVTSEYKLSDDRIIDIYRGLWRIEDSFKITKSELESRPVYVWTQEHIEAHFLTCFVALVIVRLLEVSLKRKYSVEQIINALRSYCCTMIKENIFMNLYNDDVMDAISELMDIDFGKKYMTRKEIKKLLGDTKK